MGMGKAWIAAAGIALAGAAGPAAAQDAGTMMVNFAQSIGPLMALVARATQVGGVALMIMAIVAATRIHAGKATTKQVFWTFFTGSAMIALGSAIAAINGTGGLAGTQTENILAGNMSAEGGGGHCGPMKAILLWVQFIGLVAFARGLFLFYKHGTGEEKDGLGRGLMHLFGGSAAMNITQVALILANTFGTTAALSVLCIA